MSTMKISGNNAQFLCACCHGVGKFAQISPENMMYHHLAVRLLHPLLHPLLGAGVCPLSLRSIIPCCTRCCTRSSEGAIGREKGRFLRRVAPAVAPAPRSGLLARVASRESGRVAPAVAPAPRSRPDHAGVQTLWTDRCTRCCTRSSERAFGSAGRRLVSLLHPLLHSPLRAGSPG